jgi:protein-S-isoprenylcysteine O-methyltransferase Ste14
MKVLSALYSACVYALFFGVFLYAVGFVEGVGVPKAIDGGVAGDPLAGALIDLALVGLFAVQHSVMARPGFKRAWTRIVPEPMERSTYVLLASLILGLLCWKWRPLPALVWSLDDPLAAGLVRAVSWGGFGLALLSTFLISHFHLFGLSQGFARLLRRRHPEPILTTPLFYRWVRHPLYLGFILAFWAAPQMSVGRLLFAGAMTAYILVGVWFEERDLVAQFGVRYLEYRSRVGMLFPKLRAGRPQGEIRPARPAE